MVYRHISEDERYLIARQIGMGVSMRQIARLLGRSPSTISREVKRNSCLYDGRYRAEKAHSRGIARRHRSRRKSQYSQQEWAEVQAKLRQQWSPKQIVGTRTVLGLRTMSYETIYRRVRADRRRGGELWRHMRHMSKLGRKHRSSPATRGKVLGKRHISERPAHIELRQEPGDCEGDTVMGRDRRHCVLTLVDRATGYVSIKKMSSRTKEQASAALGRAVLAMPNPVRTITLDNGTEFHDYGSVEQAFGVEIYFATPYHSWERGSNENTNGLIRQYLPKGMCLRDLTQAQCNAIAAKLNNRPRERYGFKTPVQMSAGLRGVAL
jgi:transposase, IS30 family